MDLYELLLVASVAAAIIAAVSGLAYGTVRLYRYLRS